MIRLRVHAETDVRLRRGNGEFPPPVLILPGPGIVPQVQNELERFVRQIPLLPGFCVYSEGFEIPDETPRPHAPVEPPLRKMVEHGDPVREDERVVVGKAGDPRPQDNIFRERYGLRNEEVGSGYVFPPGREMLPYPGFPEPYPVQENELSEVGVEGFGKVRTRRVERHGKVANFQ